MACPLAGCAEEVWCKRCLRCDDCCPCICGVDDCVTTLDCQVCGTCNEHCDFPTVTTDDKPKDGEGALKHTCVSSYAPSRSMAGRQSARMPSVTSVRGGIAVSGRGRCTPAVLWISQLPFRRARESGRTFAGTGACTWNDRLAAQIDSAIDRLVLSFVTLEGIDLRRGQAVGPVERLMAVDCQRCWDTYVSSSKKRATRLVELGRTEDGINESPGDSCPSRGPVRALQRPERLAVQGLAGRPRGHAGFTFMVPLRRSSRTPSYMFKP